MNGTREHYVKQNKSDSEGQISHIPLICEILKNIIKIHGRLLGKRKHIWGMIMGG
jgi:hypothetical protein